MKIFNNTNHLAGAVLATLACASFLSCTRSADQQAVNDANANLPAQSTTSATNVDTASNTTLAANDETAPAAMDTAAPPPADESAAPAKPAKHAKAKHKAKKHHKKSADSAMAKPVAPAILPTEDDAYLYGNDVAVTEPAAVDASEDFDDTVSGTTMSAPGWLESGLSPFSQEPSGRIPAQIGSPQLTGQDRGMTVFDGPGFFQDPSAQERDLIH